MFSLLPRLSGENYTSVISICGKHRGKLGSMSPSKTAPKTVSKTAFNSPPEEHFQRLMRLLEMEAEAEKQEALRMMQRTSPAGAEASGQPDQPGDPKKNLVGAGTSC
jgi:hypothetical protein